MKHLIIILFFSIPFLINAQSVEITPGSILPKMTTAQRTSLSSPTNGMLVFDINTQSYWFRKSGSWTELPKGGSTQNYWSLNGNTIENTNSGGIKSTGTPLYSNLDLALDSPKIYLPETENNRLSWIPAYSAFRVGAITNDSPYYDSLGMYSTAIGFNTVASGHGSTSLGLHNHALGNGSTSIGAYSLAEKIGTFAIGINAYSIGDYAYAIGIESVAEGDKSFALGISNYTMGKHSFAMGIDSYTLADNSMALGIYTTTNAQFATSLGYLTSASGLKSFATGDSTRASGLSAFSGGYGTTASGDYSTAIGHKSKAEGTYSLSLGNSNLASADGATTLGNFNTANGSYSTAMGNNVSTGGKQGSFVIGDYWGNSSQLNSDANNRFSARFRGGYSFYTNANNTVGVKINPSGNSWSTISDSTKKEKFIHANTQKVLESIKQIPVGTWNYKDQESTIRHWGIMAQDFYAHFGKDQYGTIGNDTTIATSDFDGLSFAAIKGLEERTRELVLKNELLEKQVAALTQLVAEMKSDFKAEIENIMKSTASLP